MKQAVASYMVTFDDREIPKEMGAQWCKDEKAWLAPSDEVADLLMDSRGFGRIVGHIPFKIPYKDKDDAKRQGA
eukprot:3492987-Pleurochrysis_carterae.AAC.1